MSAPHQEIPRRHRISVEDYHRMAAIGILKKDSRVELIDGEIIDMPPIGTSHAGMVNRLTHLLVHALAGKAVIAVQNPVQLDGFSEPQPDIAILQPRLDFYSGAHPKPPDIIALVEVADASQRYDRDIKVPLYARHGVPEVWLVDIEMWRLEIFQRPGPDGYTEVRSFAQPGCLSLAALPEIRLDLSTIFPG